MIKTKAQLITEINALPDPITGSAIKALFTNIVDSLVSQRTGIPSGERVLFKASGNTNNETLQSGDAYIDIQDNAITNNSVE